MRKLNGIKLVLKKTAIANLSINEMNLLFGGVILATKPSSPQRTCGISERLAGGDDCTSLGGTSIPALQETM